MQLQSKTALNKLKTPFSWKFLKKKQHKNNFMANLYEAVCDSLAKRPSRKEKRFFWQPYPQINAPATKALGHFAFEEVKIESKSEQA